MKSSDRTKLLFALCRVPALKVGGRATRLVPGCVRVR
jgi:hypothetical protein